MRVSWTIVALTLLGGIPKVAAAQEAAAELPPIVSPTPAPLDARPMRFLLSTGAVVIGTRIGEDAVSIGVMTRTGVTTIRKAELVAMDYRVEAGRVFDLRQQPVPLARPAAAAPPESPREPPTRRHPGRGAIIGGSIVFGLTYGVSCLVALIGMTFEGNEGLLLAVPIVGPALWGALYDDEITTALILSGGQLLGAALLTYGVARANASEEERVALRVTPVLTAQVQGLVVSGAL